VDVTWTSLLGRRVRSIRQQKGLRQADLARRSKLSRKTIIDLEGGVLPELRVSTLLKVQRGLRLPSLEQLTSGLPALGSMELARLAFKEAASPRQVGSSQAEA